MSIINCSLNCIYEGNGKCTLDHVEIVSCTSNEDCGFFKERVKKASPSNKSKITEDGDHASLK